MFSEPDIEIKKEKCIITKWSDWTINFKVNDYLLLQNYNPLEKHIMIKYIQSTNKRILDKNYIYLSKYFKKENLYILMDNNIPKLALEFPNQVSDDKYLELNLNCGTAISIIPGYCSVCFDWRYSLQDIEKECQRILDKFDKFLDKV